MPSTRVCLWNVQNYGAGDTADYYGANSGLRNDFITDFVREQQIDVLMIQEASVNATASLQDLVAKLNLGPPPGGADWAASLCGSGLEHGSANPPANAGELTYRTDGRSEGYAVAWRTGQGARFTMVPGLNAIDTGTWAAGGVAAPASPLNLVTEGRPAEEVDVSFVDYSGPKRRRVERTDVYPAGGYTSANTVPYLHNVLQAAWPELPFPTTGRANPATLAREHTRRPAYVVLHLNINGGTPGERLCPVAAYHAPSNATQAAWGAMIAGLSRELYVTNTLGGGGAPNPAAFTYARRTVLGGDFNYEPDAWPGDYKYFTKVMGRGDDSGAACGTAPSRRGTRASRKTTVQLGSGHGHATPITSVNLDEYLYYAIDVVFFRDNSTTGERPNVPDLIMQGGNGYAATLGAFYTHLNNRANNLLANEQLVATGIQQRANAHAPWRAMYTSNYGNTFLSWANLLADLQNGQMANARRAAEFYTIFISDHLPLVVELTY